MKTLAKLRERYFFCIAKKKFWEKAAEKVATTILVAEAEIAYRKKVFGPDSKRLFPRE